ncbi:MAG TPA: hypothetical protein VIK75_00290, partial [Calditerricola sp.]
DASGWSRQKRTSPMTSYRRGVDQHARPGDAPFNATAVSWLGIGGLIGRSVNLIFTTPTLVFFALTGPALLIGLLFGSLSLWTPIMETVVNALVPSEIRATTLSILGMLGTLLTVVLNPIIGYLADRSLTTALLFCGTTILGLTFVSLPMIRRM